MATAVMRSMRSEPVVERATHWPNGGERGDGVDIRAYMAVTRALARAAARGDDEGVRRLLVRREHLLAALGRRAARPSRTMASELRALEALTMVALGADPEPPRRSPASVRARQRAVGA